MKRLFSIALAATLLFALTLPVFALERDPASLAATIDAFVAEHADNMAAASVAVFTRDEVLFEQSFGYINIPEQVANDPDAVFEWGSVTKLLVSVSVFQLAEQGLLDLDADINHYLPHGFLTGLRYSDPITMRHLLSHTAGFQEVVLELFTPQNRPHRTLGDSLRLLQPPQIFRPGEVTAYSNFGMGLAGYIVELVSGQPFNQYVQENIFAPLNMTRTALAPDLSDNEWVRAQRQHTRTYAGLQDRGLLDFKIQWYPAGMATGTIADFARFGMALLPDESGGSPLFADPQTLARLYTPTTFFSDGVTERNLNGFFAAPQLGGRVIGHGGNTAGMAAYLHNDIENGLGMVILTNQASEQNFNAVLPTRVLGLNDFAGMGSPDNDVPVSGVFRSTRSFERGYFRIAAIVMGSTMPISLPNEGGVSVPILGRIDNVADGVFLGGEDSIFPYMTFFVTADENGNAHMFSMFFADYVRISTPLAIFEVASLLLMFVSGFYGLGALTRLAYRKIRRKGKLPHAKIRVGIGAVLLLILICLILSILLASLMALTLTIMRVLGILFILLSLAAVALNALLIKEAKLGRVWLNAAMSAFAVFGVAYWQVWAFWI